MYPSPWSAVGSNTPREAGLVLVEPSMIGFLMNVDFAMPVHGSFVTLLTIALPFFIGMGLSVSAKGSASGSAER